jgi:hypothetical protein
VYDAQDIASYPAPISLAKLHNCIRGERALWQPVIEKISAFNTPPK